RPGRQGGEGDLGPVPHRGARLRPGHRAPAQGTLRPLPDHPGRQPPDLAGRDGGVRSWRRRADPSVPAGDGMILNGVAIDDEFAEAFGMKATRVIITAQNLTWAYHAATTATGFATSVIACGCEAGVERELSPDETPDGRPG